MIMKENVTNYLLALSKYVTKRGKDRGAADELRNAIRILTDGAGPTNIFCNTIDNYHLPDVAVTHIYAPGYINYLMNPDISPTPLYGYNIEICESCFDRFTEEELGAVIMHDIMQNVLSDTAKLRFMKAWTEVGMKKGDRYLLALDNLASIEEMLYFAMLQICITPFRVPVQGYDYVAADDVLEAIGLGDAYDSYLAKVLGTSNNTVEEVMDRQVEMDRRNMIVILDAASEHQEYGYVTHVHHAMPLISIERAIGVPRKKDHIHMHRKPHSVFIHDVGMKGKPANMSVSETMDESYNSPSSDYDLRFSIDKIINAMRYAETEAERDVILFKIKQLSLKIIKIREQLEKNKNPSNKIYQRIMLLQEYQTELEELRKKLVSMEIKEKRWSVYVKGDMPEGYDM